jgi:hypothetical protein
MPSRLPSSGCILAPASLELLSGKAYTAQGDQHQRSYTHSQYHLRSCYAHPDASGQQDGSSSSEPLYLALGPVADDGPRP